MPLIYPPSHHLILLPLRVLLVHLSVYLHKLVKQLEASQKHCMEARWAHQSGFLETMGLQHHYSFWMSPARQEHSQHLVWRQLHWSSPQSVAFAFAIHQDYQDRISRIDISKKD